MPITSQIGSSSLIKPGVIDSAATRPASPYEGQVIFQKDTDQLLVWNGTAWVIPNSPAQHPAGMGLVSSGTTDGTTNSVAIATAFTSTYEHYLLQLTIKRTASTADDTLYCQLYASGTVINSASTYAYASEQRYLTTQSNAGTNAEASIPLGRHSNYETTYNITFNSPQNSQIATQIHSYNVNVQNGFTVDGNRCTGIRRAEEANEGVFFYATNNFVSSWVLYGYRE